MSLPRLDVWCKRETSNSGNRVMLAGARTLEIDFDDGPLTGMIFDAFTAQFSPL